MAETSSKQREHDALLEGLPVLVEAVVRAVRGRGVNEQALPKRLHACLVERTSTISDPPYNLTLDEHAARVLQAWGKRPEYLDPSGAPMRLPSTGKAPSLSALVNETVPKGCRAAALRVLEAQLVRGPDGLVDYSARVLVTGANAIRRAAWLVEQFLSTQLLNISEDRGLGRFEIQVSGIDVHPEAFESFHKEVQAGTLRLFGGADDLLTRGRVASRGPRRIPYAGAVAFVYAAPGYERTKTVPPRGRAGAAGRRR